MCDSHEDITNRKRLEDVISTFESFEQLKGMLLLFNRESPYYNHSGFVTASLLNFESNGTVSVLAIATAEGWKTFKCDKDELVKMLSCCDAFVGADPESSFLLEK